MIIRGSEPELVGSWLSLIRSWLEAETGSLRAVRGGNMQYLYWDMLVPGSWFHHTRACPMGICGRHTHTPILLVFSLTWDIAVLCTVCTCTTTAFALTH